MMRIERKISLGGVLLLAIFASLLFLIEHIRTLSLRQVPESEASISASANARPQRRAPREWFAPAPEFMVPVAGVEIDDLADTWGQARSEGRRHQGIDIIAPEGTPVLAAADGRIVKFFDSARGGITVYQFDAEEHYVFYYAHLNRRAPGMREGDIVVKGQTLGFVGETGNATTPHLHFEVQRLGPEQRWYRAEAVNPYPYLLAGEQPR